MAEAIWEASEPDQRLDPQFYWMMQRTIYNSEIPTGTPEDATR
jgi:hypothetical protein